MRIGSALVGIDQSAHQSLLKAAAQLHQSSLRLATMWQINRAADDPAGLIAAETLRAEVTALEQASRNADRARGMVHVADAALGQVSELIGRIRQNVLAASGSPLSEAEQAAYQLEIDAALEAINYIGRTTELGGRRLLDGSAGFQTSGVNPQQVADIEVYQNAGGGQQTLEIEVTQAAAGATIALTDADAALDEDVSFELSGPEGAVVLEFAAGTSLEQVAQAVNASSQTTGVSAEVDGDTLSFVTEEVGSDAQLGIEVLEGTLPVDQTSAQGTDAVALVGGVEVTGEGNRLAISTATLQADVELVEGFVGSVDPITISGEALGFALSASAEPSATLALPNISTEALGGAAGRLSQLGSGGSASLASGNLSTAMDVLDTAGMQVLDYRARAGVFERYTVDSSQQVAETMELKLTEARSRIMDTDVAQEMSRLVRAEILFSTGISLMLLAGQRRSAMLDMFRGA